MLFQKIFLILGPLRWVLVQSESVQLCILHSWSDELTILYTLLPLNRAFHVARAWPNSKYKDINEILYRPSIVPGGGAEQVWGGGAIAPCKTATGPVPFLGK